MGLGPALPYRPGHDLALNLHVSTLDLQVRVYFLLDLQDWMCIMIS
jgi:hypothetical protein